MKKLDDWRQSAELLVEEYVAPQGVNDRRIVEAMKKIPRHWFIPEIYREYAYLDEPLPIGEEQTISQPFIVAKMTELLNLDDGDHVLEIGTGSGYQAALLAAMGMKVTTIERIEELALNAREVFQKLNYNINSIIGDGREGFPSDAPYQGIIVTAGAPKIEDAWLTQLAEGGKIVVPLSVQESLYCLLVREKVGTEKDGFRDTWFDYCRFVPLLQGIKSSSKNHENF